MQINCIGEIKKKNKKKKERGTEREANVIQLGLGCKESRSELYCFNLGLQQMI